MVHNLSFLLLFYVVHN